MPPAPSTTLRRWISIACGLYALFLAVHSISIASYIPAGILLLLAIGLLLNKAWAQHGTVCLLLLAIFVVTFGVINPYTAGDMMMQGKDPSLPKLLAWIIPLDIGLLCLAWLLDPPRKNNKR